MSQTASVKPIKQPALRARRWTRSILVHVLVIGASVLIGFPFFYMLSTSLKTVKEVYTVPLVFWPAQAQWTNFTDVWTMVPFGRFTLNSVIYTVAITLGEFMMGVTAG